MKFPAVLCLLIIFACACNSKNVQTRLLEEQKLLKDSANNTTERISACLDNNHNDSAEKEKLQLSAIHARLIAIQSSLDSLANIKQ